MAIANIKDVWELAATMMGGNYRAEIVDTNTDMSSPTTPLELTLDQFYDITRQTLLESADWLFARNHRTLRAAPTQNAAGVTKDWDPGGRWAYVYEEPRDAIQFLGFQQSYADLELVKTFHRRPLPMQRVAIANTSGTAPTYIWAANSFGGSIFRNSIWGEVVDNGYTLRTLKDETLADGSGGVEHAYRIVDGDDLVLSATTSYDNESALAFNITTSGWDWSAASYPANVTLNAIIAPATNADWDNFIFTNLRDAVGVYIIDVTDPSKWPKQFQMYLASELAFAAANVHAKSSKQITLLANQRDRLKSEAIRDLSADVGVRSVPVATTVQARW